MTVVYGSLKFLIIIYVRSHGKPKIPIRILRRPHSISLIYSWSKLKEINSDEDTFSALVYANNTAESNQEGKTADKKNSLWQHLFQFMSIETTIYLIFVHTTTISSFDKKRFASRRKIVKGEITENTNYKALFIYGTTYTTTDTPIKLLDTSIYKNCARPALI